MPNSSRPVVWGGRRRRYGCRAQSYARATPVRPVLTDADTVKSMNKSEKIAIYTLPTAEKKKFVESVRVMEAEWVEKAAQKGLPAKAMLDALHRAANRSKAK